MPEDRRRLFAGVIDALAADIVIPTIVCLILLSAWGGARAPGGAPAGGNEWHLAAPRAAEGSQEWMRLRNDGTSAAEVSITFHSETGASHALIVEVPAESGVSIRAADYIESPAVNADIGSERPVVVSLETYAPPGPQDPGGKALSVAREQLGKPYVFGAAGPSAFDCSGLAQYCFAAGAGVSLPRTSWSQANCGSPVAAEDLRPGDILGFRGWGHVGIYLGEGQYIHAPRSGDVVKISALSGRCDLCGAIRL